MPVGAQELPGKVGNDKPQKCQRPDHSGGCCNVQCDPQQQPADAAVIIYAQIDGLIFAQCQNVQQRKLFPEGKGDQRKVVWMLEKNEVSTVPISRTYRTLWFVF